MILDWCLNPGIILNYLWIVDMTLINVYYLLKSFPTRSADFFNSCFLVFKIIFLKKINLEILAI